MSIRCILVYMSILPSVTQAVVLDRQNVNSHGHQAWPLLAMAK